jgi:hypothetical protein
MNFKGKISHIGEIKSGLSKAGKEWKAVEFIVEEEGKDYPQSGVFKLMKSGEHVSNVDNFAKFNKVGDLVDVEFNLKVNKWKDSFFQELSVWKTNKVNAPVHGSTQVQDVNQPMVMPEDDGEPLPF